MRSKITIKQIALDLGVSVSTVSKALRDSYEISVKTKQRIQEYAKAKNYKPNTLALQLRNQKTKVIGIVLPKIVHHFFSTVICGIESVTSQRGYTIMVCFSDEQYAKEVEAVNVLTQRNVDGLIVSIAKESLRNHNLEHFYNIIDDEVPIVQFDRVDDSIICDKVIVDDLGAGYKATKFLIETGCNQIGIITTARHITVGWDRYQGYKQALDKYNIPLNKELVLSIDDEKEIQPQIESLLTQNIDAIFAVNEIYAALAIRAAKNQGFSIPNDISVIGFTDGLISKYASPAITTIDQHGYEMGRQAAKLLIDRIEEGRNFTQQFTTRVVASKIIVRASTKTI